MTDLFALAARKKFRYDTKMMQGLTTEQLFDLPLSKSTGHDLDTAARLIATELKGLAEESFVITKPNPLQAELESKLEIVKLIIAEKMAAEEAAKTRKDRAEKRQKLLAALDAKENEALSSASIDDLKKQLAELED